MAQQTMNPSNVNPFSVVDDRVANTWHTQMLPAVDPAYAPGRADALLACLCEPSVLNRGLGTAPSIIKERNAKTAAANNPFYIATAIAAFLVWRYAT